MLRLAELLEEADASSKRRAFALRATQSDEGQLTPRVRRSRSGMSSRLRNIRRGFDARSGRMISMSVAQWREPLSDVCDVASSMPGRGAAHDLIRLRGALIRIVVSD